MSVLCLIGMLVAFAVPTVADAAPHPLANPGTPTGLTGVAGNGTITLTWTAPSDGGSPILHYDIAEVVGGVEIARPSTPGPAKTFEFTSLDSTKEYEFFVFAVTAQGSSNPPAHSAAITPRTVPGAPTNVGGTVSSGAVLVTWTAPASDGGAQIVGYRVQAFVNGALFNTYVEPTATTHLNVSGLANGTAYQFNVAAANSAGTSAFSSLSTPLTPLASLPGAPTNVKGVAANKAAVVSWTAPASDGGSPITGYSITAFLEGSPVGSMLTGSTATTFTVTGLINNARFEFEVAAINSSGPGPLSAHSDFVTPMPVPDAPTAVASLAQPGTATVLLQFTAPSGNGSPVTGFRITGLYGPNASSVVISEIYDLDGQDLVANPVVQKFLNGVPPGLGITFAVSAINAVGEGPATRATPVFTSTPPAVTPVDPGRLMDTRSDGTTVDGLVQSQGLRPAGSITPLKVAGRAGVAADATAVALNVTVTEAQAPGFLTVYPCGGDPPTASSVNYSAGSTIPNLVVSKVDADGQVCVYTQSPVQLVADVNGYFNATSGLVPVVPARLLDTRKGSPTVDGVSAGGGRAAAGSVTEFQVTGRANVPADASAAVLNVTATNEAADGFVTVYPCGQAPPNASNLNFSAGQTIANAVVSKIGALGKVCVFNQTATDLVVDLNGYFPATSPLTPLPPARLMDTRAGFVTVDGQSQAIGTRPADSVTELKINGRGGVPKTAEAVALNVTVTGSAGPGFLTIYPCGTTRPTASNVNFSAGQTIPNAVLAKIGPNGTICIYTQTAADVIVDVNAAFS